MMRIRPIVIGRTNDQIYGVGGFASLLNSSLPDQPGFGGYPSWSLSASQSLGIGAQTTLSYLLFDHSILPGEAKIFTFGLTYRPTISGALTAGSVLVTLMTSPAVGWNPTTITYNSRPAIDTNDPTIECPINIKATTGGLEPDQSLFRGGTFDLTKVTKPIVGMALYTTMTSGGGILATLGGDGVILNPQFLGPNVGPVYQVNARSSGAPTDNGSLKTLYIGAAAAAQLVLPYQYPDLPTALGFQVSVYGVGETYDDIGPFSLSGGVVSGTDAPGIDPVLGLVSYWGLDFTEDKTASRGFIKRLY